MVAGRRGSLLSDRADRGLQPGGLLRPGLADYYVFVSDVSFSSTSLSDTLARPGVWSHHETAPAGRPTTIPVGRGGWYVRRQLAVTGQLALAEVQVLTAPSR